jgi:hypothetical protein
VWAFFSPSTINKRSSSHGDPNATGRYHVYYSESETRLKN